MGTALFVYGSLQYEAVWSLLLQRPYVPVPAQLNGYRRVRIENEGYPALVIAPAYQVNGLLHRHLEPLDLARLDAFEGQDYQRITAQVRLIGENRLVAAEVYIWQLNRFPQPNLLTEQDWDQANFEQEGLARFLERYKSLFLKIKKDF